MKVQINNLALGAGNPLFVMAGPCVIESFDQIFNTAKVLKDLSRELGFALVFKASFDKANRTSFSSFRGPGLERGLEMLDEIKRKLGVPIVSDVHEVSQCKLAAAVLDVIQIPAFLCRQTDLVVHAACTGKPVNIKKGQFVAPQDMLHIVQKVTEQGNKNVFVTERGTTFGYNNLIVDYRSIPIMQEFCPVIFDATHSVQLPSASQGVSGGDRRFIPTLVKSAIAAGCDGVFMEVHPNPDAAKSDAATQIPLSHAKDLLSMCVTLHKAVSKLNHIDLPGMVQCVPALITT